MVKHLEEWLLVSSATCLNSVDLQIYKLGLIRISHTGDLIGYSKSPDNFYQSVCIISAYHSKAKICLWKQLKLTNKMILPSLPLTKFFSDWLTGLCYFIEQFFLPNKIQLIRRRRRTTASRCWAWVPSCKSLARRDTFELEVPEIYFNLKAYTSIVNTRHIGGTISWWNFACNEA